MKKLFACADAYLASRDWKMVAVLKFCLLALGLLFLAGVLLGGGHLPGALLGTASGLMDTALFLWGVHRGMGKPPAQAALSMHRMMFLRIAVLLGLTVLALREKWQSVLVLAGFLVLNIGLIIQLAKSRPGCRKL